MNEKHMPCAYWREGEICAKGTEPGYTDFCVLGPCSQMKPSNGDRIRQKSDEELAQLFVQISLWRKPATYDAVSGFCLDDGVVKEKEWLEWLKQEAESDA